MLTEPDAPASDGPLPNAPLVGTGEDPRVRRDAPVDDSILVGHVRGGIEPAVGFPLPADAPLTSGQHAIYALATGITQKEVQYVPYTFIEDNPRVGPRTDLGRPQHRS